MSFQGLLMDVDGYGGTVSRSSTVACCSMLPLWLHPPAACANRTAHAAVAGCVSFWRAEV